MADRDGGTAFPQVRMFVDLEKAQTGSVELRGMTLRDYFAGQALAGMWAHPQYSASPTDVDADICYKMADSMLFRREARDGR